ncbi:MAG: hypothetical protein HQK52_04960 [Oligoflexia bacterium]|nr:hypothetical protein [Oligoflexia bacterium]
MKKISSSFLFICSLGIISSMITVNTYAGSSSVYSTCERLLAQGVFDHINTAQETDRRVILRDQFCTKTAGESTAVSDFDTYANAYSEKIVDNYYLSSSMQESEKNDSAQAAASGRYGIYSGGLSGSTSRRDYDKASDNKKKFMHDQAKQNVVSHLKNHQTEIQKKYTETCHSIDYDSYLKDSASNMSKIVSGTLVSGFNECIRALAEIEALKVVSDNYGFTTKLIQSPNKDTYTLNITWKNQDLSPISAIQALYNANILSIPKIESSNPQKSGSFCSGSLCKTGIASDGKHSIWIQHKDKTQEGAIQIEYTNQKTGYTNSTMVIIPKTELTAAEKKCEENTTISDLEKKVTELQSTISKLSNDLGDYAGKVYDISDKLSGAVGSTLTVGAHTKCQATVYKTFDNTWKIKLNGKVNASTTITQGSDQAKSPSDFIDFQIAGVTFAGLDFNAISCFNYEGRPRDVALCSGYARTKSGHIRLESKNGQGFWNFSGDIPLAEKPTWAN